MEEVRPYEYPEEKSEMVAEPAATAVLRQRQVQDLRHHVMDAVYASKDTKLLYFCLVPRCQGMHIYGLHPWQGYCWHHRGGGQDDRLCQEERGTQKIYFRRFNRTGLDKRFGGGSWIRR